MNVKLMRGVLGIAILLLLCLMVFTEEELGPAAAPKGIELSFCNNDQSFGGQARDPDLQQAVVDRWIYKTGYAIKAIIIPNANYKDKLNVMFASGDIPDIVRIQQAMNFVPTYAAREVIMPIDKYIANNPILQQFDKRYFNYMPVKGQGYYIPYYKPMNKYIWFRNDMVNQFGINVKKTMTTEEFFNEMKKVVGSNIVPFTFPKFADNFQFFYNSFGIYVNAFAPDKSGKIIDGFNTKECKEGLAYIKRLYDAGIWYKEFITCENAQMREMMSKGKTASDIDYFNRYSYYCVESAKAAVATEFIPMYKLVGPRGDGGTLNEAIQDAFVISAKCKNPQAAVDFVAWLNFTAEGRKTIDFGIYGKHYTIANGIGVGTEKAAATGYKLSSDSMYLDYVTFDNLEFNWDFVTQQTMPRQMEIAQEVNNYAGPAFPTPAGLSDAFDKNAPTIKTTREQIAAKIVLGNLTMDEGYAQYNQFWKSIGGDAILKELNDKLVK